MTQLTLELAAPPAYYAPAVTIKITGTEGRLVYQTLLCTAQWLTLAEIQRRIKNAHDKLYSDASISARIRGLKKYGIQYDRRQRTGSSAHEYRLKVAA